MQNIKMGIGEITAEALEVSERFTEDGILGATSSGKIEEGEYSVRTLEETLTFGDNTDSEQSADYIMEDGDGNVAAISSDGESWDILDDDATLSELESGEVSPTMSGEILTFDEEL